VIVVDLAAETTPALDSPRERMVSGASVQVASPHDLLVDKLCALLGRAEIRDLVDVRALLGAGEDLDRALRDAPRRDAGFSPLTLAWVIRGLPVASLAQSADLPTEQAAELARFRDELVARLASR
jgi:predicted nucleotidyltransferase